MLVKGVNGQLEVREDDIVIHRKGFLAMTTQGFKGEKVIPFRSITAIQFRKPGFLTNGYIQFSIAGGIESRGALRDATKDENSIIFTPGQYPTFQQAFSLIEKGMTEAPRPSGTQSISSLRDLETLARLKEQGVVSEEEFEIKKKEILGV